MNNENETALGNIPESILILQAQNALKQVLSTYPLKPCVWKLLIDSASADILNAYKDELMADQKVLQQQMNTGESN